MKNRKLLLLLFLLPLFITAAFMKDSHSYVYAGKYSGTVSFLRKTTGGHTVFFEWRMEATIEEGEGTVVHSYESENDEGVTAKCKNEAETELQLGIDKEAKKYSIWVDVPGCYGTKIDHGVQSDFGATDETAITINNQPLPDDPKFLTGRLITKDTNPGDGSVTTETYDWTLEKDKKKKKVPQ